jgi:hypothetical protein
MRVTIITSHGTPLEFDAEVVYQILLDGEKVYDLSDNRPEEPVDARQTEMEGLLPQGDAGSSPLRRDEEVVASHRAVWDDAIADDDRDGLSNADD